MRSVSKRVIAIAQALRHKGTEGELERKAEYRQLLRLTRQILNDSRRVLQDSPQRPPPGYERAGGTIANHGRTSARRRTTDQGAGVRRPDPVSGKTAESV